MFPFSENATTPRGRPTKECQSSSEKSKGRKTEELRSSFSTHMQHNQVLI